MSLDDAGGAGMMFGDGESEDYEAALRDQFRRGVKDCRDREGLERHLFGREGDLGRHLDLRLIEGELHSSNEPTEMD